MTYDEIDTSVSSGEPVELYLFTQGAQRWTLTTASMEITHNALIYTPAPVSRTSISQNDDVFKNKLSLKFPRDNIFASQFISATPDLSTILTIFRGHRSIDNYITYWKGRVVGASLTNNLITIDCESIFTSVARMGLRAKFELNCRHPLYSGGCRVSAEHYRTDTIIHALSDQAHLEIAAAANRDDGYYKGGMLKLSNGASRLITGHVGSSITLSRPLDDLAVGVNVSIYAGCNHSVDECDGKFDNLDNFGGFPHFSGTNPFGGSSIV